MSLVLFMSGSLILIQTVTAQTTIEAVNQMQAPATIQIEAYYESGQITLNAQSSYSEESAEVSIDINHQSWQFIAVDQETNCQAKELGYSQASVVNRFLNLNTHDYVSQWYCFKVSDVLGNKGYLKFQVPADDLVEQRPYPVNLSMQDIEEAIITTNQSGDRLVVTLIGDNPVTWAGTRINVESECSEDNQSIFNRSGLVFTGNSLRQLTAEDNGSWYCFRALEIIEDQSGASLQKLHFKAVQIQDLVEESRLESASTVDQQKTQTDLVDNDKTAIDDKTSSPISSSQPVEDQMPQSQSSAHFEDNDNSSGVIIVILVLTVLAVIVVVAVSRRSDKGEFVLGNRPKQKSPTTDSKSQQTKKNKPTKRK